MIEAPTLSRKTTTRVCVTCNTERPTLLFPKKKNGALRQRCQLCRDSGQKRRPKDVIGLSRARSLKGARMRKAMTAARN